jgi:hypothetical protein
MSEIIVEAEGVITPFPGGQEQFANDWSHFILGLEGGWMSGKTTMGGAKLATLHIYNSCDNEGAPTYVPSIVVAPTFSNATDFDVPVLLDVFKKAGLSTVWKGSGTIGGGKLSGPAIILPDLGTRHNPSAILVRTADNPKRITGFEVGAAWGDEAGRWKHDPHNPLGNPIMQLLGRIRHPAARLLMCLFTYTNEGDATGIFELMHGGKEECRLYRASSRENPLAKEFVARQIRFLTAELAKQYIDGGAASLRGGKVYGSFEDAVHVSSSAKMNPDRPPQVSLDFNIMPGMHAEIGQHHEDADLFTVCHEIHGPRMTTKETAQKVVEYFKEAKWDFNKTGPLEVFGDATGTGEWSGTGQSNYDIIKEVFEVAKLPYRLRLTAANPLVVDRINAMNIAMKDACGGVHYKVNPSCIRLIEDLRKLMLNQYGEIDKKDMRYSHPSDADGYRVHYLRPIRRQIITTGGQFSV